MKMDRTDPTRFFGFSRLSVVIPCYDEEKTLRKCVERVLEVADETLALEIIIVDDGSTDGSLSIARALESEYAEIKVLAHDGNRGKGAALRTGFQAATGDFVAVQDADLEYDPMDLKRLLAPMIDGHADVVFGSRFLAAGPHRVLYFWHYLGNRFLTFVSNMFTDLNLTDMETCYKVFKREVIQGIEIREDRFGFEPEIVARVAQKGLRIYEMGISYYGRTYAEGKKIGARDGFRALYCILKYNAPRAPLPVQFLLYLFIGGLAALLNLLFFLVLTASGAGVNLSAPTAFAAAAFFNYVLCVRVLFHHETRRRAFRERASYWCVVALVCILDLFATRFFLHSGMGPAAAKILASGVGLAFNFAGRRYIVFPTNGR